MTFNEYERLLKLSEIQLYAEVHFQSITVPISIIDSFDYLIENQRRLMCDIYKIPRTMMFFNLDGI